MKLSLSWLSEFVKLTAPDRANLSRRLSEMGVEVAAEERAEGDHVFEIEITPNRGDLLSVFGMAREISCALNRHVRHPASEKIPAPARRGFVRIEKNSGCRRYLGARISNVRVGPSPESIAKKLRLARFASFNNIVDVTNYVLAELGQPLHAFDADKLSGSIHVRRARPGEKISALDGKTYDLDKDLVIADDARPVAIAGVIGGSETAVSSGTRNVFLECAWFEPSVVRRASRRLGLATESSFRFERTVDPEGLDRAFFRAVALIEKFAGGHLAWIQMEGAIPKSPARMVLSSGEVARLLGVDIPAGQIRSSLEAVGCKTSQSGKNRWNVIAPSWRPDLREPHDLIEEIARLYGIDRIPAREPVVRPAARSEGEKTLDRIRRAAIEAGLIETVHMSFVDEKSMAALGVPAKEAVALQNPLSLAASHLRPTLLPGLLATTSLNLRREAASGVRLFEIASVFIPGRPPREEIRLGLVLCGRAEPAHFSRNERACDFFDLKAILESILAGSGRCRGNFDCVPAGIPGFDPSVSSAISWEGTTLGCLGRIASTACAVFDISMPAFAAEISLSRLLSMKPIPILHTPVPRFPSIRRDLSLVLKISVTSKDVRREVLAANLPDLVTVDIFDLYRGDKLPAETYALGLSMTFQSPSRSLSDDEANAARDSALKRLGERLGAAIR